MKTWIFHRAMLGSILALLLGGCSGKPSPEDYIGTWNMVGAPDQERTKLTILAKDGTLVSVGKTVICAFCDDSPSNYKTLENPIAHNSADGSITITSFIFKTTFIADASALFEIKIGPDGHPAKAKTASFKKVSP